MKTVSLGSKIRFASAALVCGVIVGVLWLVLFATTLPGQLVHVNTSVSSLPSITPTETPTCDDWFKRLAQREKKVFSQYGEDGVIEEVFSRIGHGQRQYAEFGVESGVECNTRHLRERHNWTGLMMDGSHDNPALNLHQEMIYVENIVALFEKYQVPRDLDFLSIDIDSTDLFVWRALMLAGYRPRLLAIEYNRNFPDGLSVTFPPTHDRWKGTFSFGASLTALEIVGNEFNYTLVYTTQLGINAFFMPRALLCNPAYRYTQTNNEPLHAPRYDPAMVVYLGTGHYRPVPDSLSMPGRRTRA